MSLSVRTTGRLEELDQERRREIVDRARRDTDVRVEARVREILARVRDGGDAALLEITREIDGVLPASIEVERREIDRALAALEPSVRAGLERAKQNLERVCRAMLPPVTEVESEPGVLIGRRADPLAAVGVYAPGGRAAYPSSVLMGAVPARVAGVPRVVVCSPPGPSGLPSDVVLAAAGIAGASSVLALGGAQAIAALAFGTASTPRVDRIVGPGNAYVAEAKRQVAGVVPIDAPAGPSEILILADDSADPEHLAREMLAQAEHDPEASCVALVASEAIADALTAAIARAKPEKREVVERALGTRGAVLSFDDWEAALALASDYAAEHLLLAVRDPEALLPRLRHAGTVFYGPGASVAFGDYMTGANHVLPTAGAARSFSGLSILDFVRWTTYQRVTGEGAARMSADVDRLARAEGLPSHADAARAFASATPVEHRRSPPPARPSYRHMKLYASQRRPVALDLSDNTNVLGAPPSARARAASATSDDLARYPSHYGEGLKAALASRLGVGAEEIVTGCGSDDVLDSAIRAFAGPGDRLAFPTPTFAMLPFFASMNGLVAQAVPLLGPERGFDLDVEALLANEPAIVYVCSPNNPTGTLASKAAIGAVVERARGLVVLDEAYIEYGGDGFTKRAREAGNVLVVRTLSKAYGLAGARVGYAIGHPDLVAEVEKSRGPYKITRLAEAVAEQVVRQDGAWVDAGIRDVVEARGRFEAWLAERGASFVPSAANFVLVRVGDAAERAARLRERGVAVRPFPALPGFGDCLRISVAPWPTMQTALDPIAEVLG